MSETENQVPEYQQRVIAERDELAERMDKLKEFIASDTFAGIDADEQGRLRRQLQTMRPYLDALNDRINNF